MVTQEEVREKLKTRVLRERQSYIAKQIGIPAEVISIFKNGKKDLWEKTLIELNNYLDNHYID